MTAGVVRITDYSRVFAYFSLSPPLVNNLVDTHHPPCPITGPCLAICLKYNHRAHYKLWLLHGTIYRTMEWKRCMSIGDLITYYRERKGWAQKQLYTAVGIGQSRMSKLEKGKNKPSFDEMQRIALYLEQPLTAFDNLRALVPPDQG